MDFSGMARNEKGMLAGVGANVEKYTLTGIRRHHDVSKEIQYRFFERSIIKDAFIDFISRISFIAEPIDLSGEIKTFIIVASGEVVRAFPAAVHKRELR